MYFEGVFLKLLQVDLFTKRGNLRTFGSCDENVNFLLKFIILIHNFFRIISNLYHRDIDIPPYKFVEVI